MNRDCPACRANKIPVSGLIVSAADCPGCGALVGVHWFWRILFFLVTLLVTVPSTIAVLAQQGVYAALLWLPFPIGAIGYLKARFFPLETKRRRPEPRRASHT